MKRNFLVLFLLLSVSLLCEQCKKESKLGTIFLTDEAMEFFPYEGGEEIVFIDSIGDEIPYTIEEPKIQITDEGGYSREKLTVAPLGLSIDFTDPNYPPIKTIFSINFKFDDHPEITWGMQGNWILESGKLKSCSSGICSTAQYYDSLTIVNKKFYKVYELSLVNIPPYEAYKTLYYNIEEGVIGFKTNFGRRWRID
jgi:hypothetical protein